MRKFLAIAIFSFLGLLIGSAPVSAAAPTGHVDVVDGTRIAGWASDPDISGAIPIHVYIDNVLVHDQQTDASHAFNWIHAPIGAGDHSIKVYAVGVNAQGQPDGQNMLLSPTPTSINVGCARLVGEAFNWCRDNPAYWINRQADTKLLSNNFIKIGINISYGGLITQLYNQNRDINLIEEHGGSAVQISLYGSDTSNGPNAKWFGATDSTRCDPVGYATDQDCKLHNTICHLRAYATGAHVANCQSVLACNLPVTDPGWPFNPIQAQAVNCLWNDASNDVDYSAAIGNGWETHLVDPYQYSKSNVFSGLTITQQVTLGDVYAKVHYKLDYAGSYTTDFSSQELPAFFTNPELNRYYYYSPYDQSYTDPYSPVTRIDRTVNTTPVVLASPSSNGVGEHWWGVCDSTETKCVTLATFDSVVSRYAIEGGGVNEASYLTPSGHFSLTPGMHHEITLYVFPYKHNDLVNGKTIRQRIFELAAQNAPSPSPTPTPSLELFDLNQDRIINGDDLKIVFRNYGISSYLADKDATGEVDIMDYAIIHTHYGQSY